MAIDTRETTTRVPSGVEAGQRIIGLVFGLIQLPKTKSQSEPHADIIDLLLDADEHTRKLLIFRALQSGELKKSEAEGLIARMIRLERSVALSRGKTQTD
jgi:hypothetical protein